MTQLIGIVGSGMVGRDPFDPRCWSRSGYHLFTRLRERGLLRRAFGVEARPLARARLLARNFRPRVERWRQRLNLDPEYYETLTGEIRRGLRAEDFEGGNAILQIGGHYDARRASGGRLPVYSYHDGNVAGMMRSPFFPSEHLALARGAFEFERSVYEGLTRIFVMAEYWKRSLVEDFGIDEGRVVNVGCGVNIEVPAPVSGKDYSGKQVVFLGIDFERKGGANLLEAFRMLRGRHPDSTLHVIGPRVVPAALRVGSLEGVEFHGHLSRENPARKERLLSVLRRGTVLALPSLYEPFGIAALEGMLYGMPVLATGDWSFPDFVTAETGVLVERPKDIREIAAKLDSLLGDPDRCARMGAAGRELVIGKYTWERVVERIRGEVEA